MRYTIVDADGAISFVGPGHGIKMMAAACSQGPSTYRDLLSHLDGLDAGLASTIRNGLSSFDEHCLSGQPETVKRWIDSRGTLEDATFRVLDELTKKASLEPNRLGLIIFNLGTRRIVQVQNAYGPLMRSDRGRIRRNSRPTRQFYRYDLPNDWSIVP